MQDACHTWTSLWALLNIESLRLCGRASEHGIRRSEIRFLMGTRNVFFVPRSWQDEITTFSISLPGSTKELKVRFFLGGILVFFFSKKVLALPCILIKKTPDPQPLGDWQKCDPPLTTTWYVPRLRHLRTFRSWTQNVWNELYLDIECVRAETRKCEQSVWDIYVL